LVPFSFLADYAFDCHDFLDVTYSTLPELSWADATFKCNGFPPYEFVPFVSDDKTSINRAVLDQP